MYNMTSVATSLHTAATCTRLSCRPTINIHTLTRTRGQNFDREVEPIELQKYACQTELSEDAFAAFLSVLKQSCLF